MAARSGAGRLEALSSFLPGELAEGAFEGLGPGEVFDGFGLCPVGVDGGELVEVGGGGIGIAELGVGDGEQGGGVLHFVGG